MTQQALQSSLYERIHPGTRYSVDGVTLLDDGSGPTLTFLSEGNLVRERLRAGGPAQGSGETVTGDGQLRYWYNRPIKSWVIVHRRGETEAGAKTNTLFVRDSGRIIMRRGFLPSLAPQGILLGVGAIIIALLWVLALYGKAM